MLDNLAIVLFQPKFPENIGAAARACVNMGCSEMVCIDDKNRDMNRAPKKL